jgi:hypothetical protein
MREEDAPARPAWSQLPTRRVSTYRLLISHRYSRSEEYERLVRMLDRAAARDLKWRWKNYSVPAESPIMTESEARQAEVYEGRLRARMSQVHAVLYIVRDEWLAEMGSIYHELVEATVLRYGTQVPIISILPQGANLRSLEYRPHGVATVKWHSASIVRAICEHALPVFASEMRLTRAEAAERTRIVELLQANAGRIAKTAVALGVSKSELKQRILRYAIR